MTALSSNGPKAACGIGPDSQSGGAYPTHRQSQVMGHCRKPVTPTSTTTEKQHEGETYSRPGWGASLTYHGAAVVRSAQQGMQSPYVGLP